MTAFPMVTFESLFAEPVRNGVYKSKEFHGRGQKMVNMRELFAFNFISNQDMSRIELSEKEKEKYLLKKGDLIFARRSLVLAGSGKCSIIEELNEQTTFESSIIRARLDTQKVNPWFYYYLFHSRYGRDLILSFASQTAVSGIRGSDLSRMHVPYPSKAAQNKITTVLLAYDRLIENNNSRIEVLEKIAKLVYDEWFVKFRFLGQEKVRTVHSDLGEIPEGWEVKRLGDLIEFKKGKQAKDIFERPTAGSVPYLLIDGVKNGAYMYTNEKGLHVNRKDIIMVMDGASSGTVYTGQEGYAGSTFARIDVKDKSISPYFIMLFLASNFDKISSNNTGAAIPHANKDYIYGMDITIPKKGLREQIFNVFGDLFSLKTNLELKKASLRKARDILLLQLVSGEINVSNLAIKIPEDKA